MTVIAQHLTHDHRFSGQVGQNSTMQRQAQEFTPAASSTDQWEIDSVRLWMEREGTPGWTMTVEIWTNSGDFPDAVIANGVSNGISSSAITQDDAGEERTFTFPEPKPAISDSTTYFFVVRNGDNIGTVNPHNFMRVHGADSDVLPEVRRNWDGGGDTWDTDQALDYYFIVEGTEFSAAAAPRHAPGTMGMGV